MADVELVIRIPKETYEYIKKYQNVSGWKANTVVNAINNGTPLPKGHGRLIDADTYAKKYDININGQIGGKYIFAPTIIEADKEE